MMQPRNKLMTRRLIARCIREKEELDTGPDSLFMRWQEYMFASGGRQEQVIKRLKRLARRARTEASRSFLRRECRFAKIQQKLSD